MHRSLVAQAVQELAASSSESTSKMPLARARMSARKSKEPKPPRVERHAPDRAGRTPDSDPCIALFWLAVFRQEAASNLPRAGYQRCENFSSARYRPGFVPHRAA